MAWEDTAYDWALEFDAKMKDLILARDHKAIVDYSKLGRSARLTVPTLDHYLPLLYVLGAQDKEDSVGFFADKVTPGSMFPTSQPRVGSVLPRLGARADRPPSLTDRISVIFDGQPASSSCWLSRSMRKSARAVRTGSRIQQHQRLYEAETIETDS